MRLGAFAAFWEQPDLLDEPLAPPSGMEATESGLSDAVRAVRSALSASEARLRVAVKALGRITTGPGSIAGARDIARQALATIEDRPHDH
jgi:hypothetical protein